MKAHLRFRYTKEGKTMVSKEKMECGKLAYWGELIGRPMKTKEFREFYQEHGEEAVCLTCLKRAKEQGRIK